MSSKLEDLLPFDTVELPPLPLAASPQTPSDGTVCPRCGARIPEGKLYCESCGEEIRFVPEFEPEVDDSIQSVMTDVAQEIASEKASSAQPPAGALLRREDTEADPFLDFHIRIPRRAVRYAGIGACAALLLVAAVVTVPRVLRLEAFDRNLRAREEVPQIIGAAEPEPSVVETVPDAPSEAPAAEEAAVTPEAPRLDQGTGSYQGGVSVAVVNRDKGLRYYFTTDGSQPDETSERYLGPILLDAVGETTLRMIAVTEDGRTSEETVAVYTVETAPPDAPVILEDSGDYTQSTMIVAVMQEGCRITYTTDGSDPTEDSTEYTAPIKMPVGTSLFRFRAFDADGKGSEVVERSYHLVYARLVSEEQAVAAVIRVLIGKNVLLDETGKVLGKGGRNVYQVESAIEIEGAGEYYRIVERYAETDGTVSDTGLLYAVNTNDGSVHRLGYDSSGKYTLFTLSANR